MIKKRFLANALFLSILASCYMPALADVPEHSADTTTRRCLDCHKLYPPTHGPSTPVKAKVPQGWPTDSKGRLICLTCHDCKSGSCILRQKSPALCRSCHDCTQGMGCLINVAHMGNSNDIEANIRDCLQCHDGSIGKLVPTGVEQGGHPVDVLYLVKNGYKRIKTRKIVLVQGKVTCLSCHNPYKTDKERLVMSNEGSGLCLTCHNK
jgi:predicted CXXCH cytochrome family protein